ncbi:MAG: tetratricopeptide repeat protein [Gammaproteobacteria bacterium]|nr:tetratricopeptide repeat protein [Gammaproteobacteria bacterium]
MTLRIYIVLLSFLLFYSSTILADRQTFAMSEFVFNEMQTIQGLVEADQYPQAFAALKLLREKRLSEYERAHTWNLAAFAYYKQENYEEAIKAYQRMLKTEPEYIPEGLRLDTIKKLGQLSLIVENYKAAIYYSKKLLKLMPVPDPAVYITIGQAYYNLEEYKKAEKPIRKAINLTRKTDRKVKENWLLLLNAVYYSLLDFKGMQLVLRELITEYPRAKYMLNLAAVYSELDDTVAQTTLMESLYESGHLQKENQLVNLANLYMLHKVPYKAAVLLEESMVSELVESNERNFVYLAQAWQLAGNIGKAIEPLKNAASLAEDGNTYVRLAQLHISQSQWRDAEKALSMALDKGELKNKPNVYLLLGMSRFNQKHFDDARTAFQTAGKDEKMSRLASQWINYARSEQEKYDILKK